MYSRQTILFFFSSLEHITVSKAGNIELNKRVFKTKILCLA